MLYLAGIVITFFLALPLVSKSPKTVADLLLSAWLEVIGIHLFLYYRHITDCIYYYPNLLGLSVPLPLVQGPFLYLNTRAVTGGRLPRRWWAHFLPTAIAFAGLYKFFALAPEKKIWVYQDAGAGFETYSAVILTATIASGFRYMDI